MTSYQVRRLMGATMGVGTLEQATRAAEDFARATGGIFYVYNPCGEPVAGFDGSTLEPITEGLATIGADEL